MTPPGSSATAWSLSRIAGLALAVTAARLLVYAVLASGHGPLDQALCRWDCGWYLDVMTHGYGAEPASQPPHPDFHTNYDEANWVFFPLYPLLARTIAWLTRLSPLDGAILLSALSTAGFLVVSSLYLRRTRAGASIPLWMAFALSYPHSFYLSVPYTESLYLFLTSAALLQLAQDRPYRASLFSALASATRPVGALLAPAMAARGFAALKDRFRRTGRLDAGAIADALLPVVIAPLGLFLFAAFLYWRTGDALAFAHGQVAWGRHWRIFPLELIFGYWHWDLAGLPEDTDTLNAIFATLMFAVAAFLARRRRFLECFLCLGAVIVPLSTSTDSMARFAAGTPVFLFGLYEFLFIGRPRPVVIALVALFCLVQAVLLHYWFARASFLV